MGILFKIRRIADAGNSRRITIVPFKCLIQEEFELVQLFAAIGAGGRKMPCMEQRDHAAAVMTGNEYGHCSPNDKK